MKRWVSAFMLLMFLTLMLPVIGSAQAEETAEVWDWLPDKMGTAVTDAYSEAYFRDIDVNGVMVQFNGTDDQCQEVEPNDTLADANIVDRNCVISGALYIGDPADIYTFTLDQWAQVTIVCESSMDSIVFIYDPAEEILIKGVELNTPGAYRFSATAAILPAGTYYMLPVQPTANFDYYQIAFQVEPTDHRHDYTSVIVPPTCGEEGGTVHACSCGMMFMNSPVPPTGNHSYANKTDPTCNVCGDPRAWTPSGEVPVVSNGGKNMQEAEELALETTYRKYWLDESFQNTNHYYKFTVTEPGVVSFRITRPVNLHDRGMELSIQIENPEKGQVAIYGENGEHELLRQDHVFHVGVDAGTYYIRMWHPYSWGNLQLITDMSLCFWPMSDCEIEPNATGTTATELEVGQLNNAREYVFFFGGDMWDYLKFQVVQGHTYRLTMTNMGDLDVFSAIYEDGTAIPRESLTDANGVLTYEFTAETTGERLFRYVGKDICFKSFVQVVDLTLGEHVHEYEQEVHECTCVEDGYTVYRCACGDSYTAGFSYATGLHLFSDDADTTCDTCGFERPIRESRPVVHMFRMYDPNSGEHFYTGSEEERDNLISAGWNYEGVGFTFPLTTGDPVHRLYDPVYGEHLYTMDEAEMNALLEAGWNYEGVAFNSAFEDEVPQYRLHNPNANRGAYHFTSSIEERDFLISVGWEYQGIGWYSCWK